MPNLPNRDSMFPGYSLENKKQEPTGDYVNSRYYRGHTNITSAGLKIELGESYLMNDGEYHQVMSTEVLGDSNILIRRLTDNKYNTVHAGFSGLGLLEFICKTDDVRDETKLVIEKNKVDIITAHKKKLVSEFAGKYNPKYYKEGKIDG